MLDALETEQADLRSGVTPWKAGLARPSGESLGADLRCEVAIIGAGITGAMLAEHLAARGHGVVLVDRERPGFGSTLASTAMLLWEIDKPLRELAFHYGFERAADIYRRSFKAVEGLRDLIIGLALPCAFYTRDSLYLAAAEVGPAELGEEHELRRRAGLPGAYLGHDLLLKTFGFDRAAALVSTGAAEADPLSLCHALLARAAQQGVRLVRDEAVAFDGTSNSAMVQLAGGRVIEAGHVVLATGYVMPDLVKSDLHSVFSSWALATLPQRPQALWPGRALVWEASETYAYCRTTSDGCIVLGGEDEAIADPDQREGLEAQKTEALRRKLAALLPAAVADVGHAWSGAFGQTVDGLPLIGRVPGQPRMLAAYGYGGNGITFSYLASRVIGSLIGGQEMPWFAHFAIDRPNPQRP
ncbi:FAD-dependent oxidoreductase [Bosea sp. BK604]|uniref:NAD(P)/FAD-dependent oxidoreductase n=1 Tax=Bosea sp. BK604 TaxID=2512180 RepID=UPI0010456A5B|nr:FAD-dependent oxidoreductase [Bosea sp. BK604]TCR68776.1 glycine/D-amino acid oxidase-like deaminating enzyme [Bosea sp. BK604]